MTCRGDVSAPWARRSYTDVKSLPAKARTSALLPASWGQPPTTTDPLTSRALQVQAAAGPLVTFLAPVRVPGGPVLVDGRGKTDWIVLDTRLDTHLAQRRLAIPRGPRRHLEKIADSGARFDALLIGHELPAGTVAKARIDGKSDDIDSLLGDPPVDRAAVKAVAAVRAAVDGLKATAVLLGKGTAAAASGIASVADGVLDPVVLGVVTADGKATPGDRAALFHLVHWT